MKIGLDKKILAGVIACCLIVFIVAIASFRNSEKFLDTAQWVAHTHEVLYELEQILVSVTESETGARGFAITGNEDYLQPFNMAKANIAEHIVKVRELTSDNPAQQKKIDLLAELSQKHMNQLNMCIELRRQTPDPAKMAEAVAASRKILNEIRNLVAVARTVEEGLLIQRKGESEKDASGFSRLFILLVTSILVILSIGYLFIMNNIRLLRKLEKESADKNWILIGTEEVVRCMQGDKSTTKLGQDVLSCISRYLQIPLGAFYVTGQDKSSLRLVASFGLPDSISSKSIIPFGEGFAGQVAKEQRTMILSDLKSEHHQIKTGFGIVKPQQVLALPFMFENSTIGVIELGSLKEFDQQQMKYLQLIGDGIAIGVKSSLTREMVDDLLEETQRQAEELEVQQEELRQHNEELHAKTDLLERSETEMRIQQAELENANIDLEEKATLLGQQKLELEEAKKEIERKAREVEISSQYKSEFLANMSHELRTPLNSILILAQLLSENKNKNLSAKETEFARNIHTSGTGLLTLINEILDLSKIEAGKMELEIETFKVSDVVHAVSDMVSGMAVSKSITYSVDIDPGFEQLTINSDRQRIEQILRNLLSNAIKFTPEKGKVSLIIGPPPEDTVFKDLKLKDKVAVITFGVRDTGIGIAEDKRELIFQAFQQADGSTKRKYGGTGLGLSISRELAGTLGGEIQLISEEGRGSMFMLFLPAEYAPASNKNSSKASVFDKVHTLNFKEQDALVDENFQTIASNDDRNSIIESDKVVLIIEDDEKFAHVLLDFIRERGYKGVIANQGNVGLSYARHYRPIAILLDIQLPVMDGNDVIRQLKNDPELRHIPVQIISAYDKKKEGMTLGAFDYLPKPVSITDLQNAFGRIEEFTNKKVKKLLIVEDDEHQNKAISELLSAGDIKSVSAHTGEEAYELLTHDTFDCMIIDLGLPQMSGFDLMEKIRSDKNLNRIPIIVNTGRDLSKDDTLRLKKLADTVVIKTNNSHERLLDETTLFLHRAESLLPKDKQLIIQKLHKSDEVLRDKRILLVDDDIRNIYSLTNALEEEGVNCLTAENGKVALQLLKENGSVDLVLMDVMMPEMDGYEATREIRKLDKFRKLPIIALTAKAMKGDKEKCIAAGMSDYISKPVQVSQLMSLMRVWLYK